MSTPLFFVIFSSVFLAELGDKTQIATLLFTVNNTQSKVIVFLASSSALILTSAIAVLLGSILHNYINPKIISYLSGIIFIIIGILHFVKTP